MNKSVFCAVAVVPLLLLHACGSKTHSGKAGPGTDSVQAVWVNPAKGKIWEKENIVKIPLTAAEAELKGHVKMVAYKEYEFAGNEWNAKELIDSGYNLYDQAGHLADQNEYYADKTPRWHCLYQYDAKNKPKEWVLRVYEDKMNARTTFSYDANGNKTEEVTTDSNKEYNRRTSYKYDGKGNMVETDMYDKDGKLKQVISYKYDQRGFQTEYTERDEDGDVFSKLTCEYDNNGNKTGGADYSSDTTLERKWVQKNDISGRRMETDYYGPVKNLLAKRTIKYDKQGFATEYTTMRADGTMDEEKSYSYQNEYDAAGNIVKQTEIRWKAGKRIPVAYTEYVISYY